MDGMWIWLGLVVLAVAIYSGLMSVATSISKLRMSVIDVRLPNPINVEHRSDDGAPT